jgi:hypothetical protein
VSGEPLGAVADAEQGAAEHDEVASVHRGSERQGSPCPG